MSLKNTTESTLQLTSTKPINALGLGRAAENILVGIALRYELLSGSRVDWRKDKEQCLHIIRDAKAMGDADLSSKVDSFWRVLTIEEHAKIKLMSFRQRENAKII